jgi:hypothetical protein
MKSISRQIRRSLIAGALAILPVFVSPGLVLAAPTAAAAFAVIDADFASGITVDGEPGDWANLKSGIISMDTLGRGKLAVDIQYAWNQDHLYLLVRENSSSTDSIQDEAPDAAAYFDIGPNGPWNFDSIAFWMDLDNSNDNEAQRDFQPWFGFSSIGRKDLVFSRINNSDREGRMEPFENALIATGGAFAKHSRVLEIALKWSALAKAIDVQRQPNGDIVNAIQTGYTFGSEPLLVDNIWDGQAFLGPDQWVAPSGTDEYSRDIRLVGTAGIKLGIDRQGDKVILSWPATSAGFQLQSADSVATLNWINVNDAVVKVGDNNQVTLTPGAAARFFRMKKP